MQLLSFFGWFSSMQCVRYVLAEIFVSMYIVYCSIFKASSRQWMFLQKLFQNIGEKQILLTIPYLASDWAGAGSVWGFSSLIWARSSRGLKVGDSDSDLLELEVLAALAGVRGCQSNSWWGNVNCGKSRRQEIHPLLLLLLLHYDLSRHFLSPPAAMSLWNCNLHGRYCAKN